MMVGIYATIAWTFFFQTVTESLFLALAGGLFLGAFIVCLDRALIASLSKGNGGIASLSFRLLLALLLGIFLSQPIILKLYQPEIQREATILQDLKNQERKMELEKLYAANLNTEKQNITKLEALLESKNKELLKAESDFKSEMDGSGGTGKWGYNTVARQKEKILDQHRAEFNTLNTRLPNEIATSQKKIDSLNTKIEKEMIAFQSNHEQTGTLLQVEAPQSLLKKDESGSLTKRYYLLSIILVLIELSALIAKLLFKMNSYKQHLQLAELTESKELEIEKTIALSRLENYKELALGQDKKTQQSFFNLADEATQEKVVHIIDDWKKDNDGTLKLYWKRLKEKLMIS
jgi:hypothetical protein